MVMKFFVTLTLTLLLSFVVKFSVRRYRILFFITSTSMFLACLSHSTFFLTWLPSQPGWRTFLLRFWTEWPDSFNHELNEDKGMKRERERKKKRKHWKKRERSNWKFRHWDWHMHLTQHFSSSHLLPSRKFFEWYKYEKTVEHSIELKNFNLLGKLEKN